MRKLLKRQSVKAGMSPGAMVHVGHEPEARTRLSVIRYDEHSVHEEELPTDAGCPAIQAGAGVTWIMVSGLGDVEVLRGLGDCFDLHPLVLEDILNTGQRPKLEQYPDYIYLVAEVIRWDEDSDELQPEQISIIIGANYVITVQESDADAFAPIKVRVRAAGGRIRSSGADYLAYALLDAIVDGYFLAIEHLGDQIDPLERTVTDDPTPEHLHAIYRIKRELVVLRRFAWPLREAVVAMYREETPLVSDGVRLYLRDVHDHTVQVIETTEALRDVVSGLLDLYMSTVSNRMNSVMQVLTIVATLFIPLTFIAGVYGMNFKYMPELGWPWAYPAVLCAMGVLTIGMLLYFRRKRWL